MTIIELLTYCGREGRFVKVKIDKPIRNSNSYIGQVTQIRPDGCAVRFNDMPYDKWFHADDQNDKRTKCMKSLTYLKP